MPGIIGIGCVVIYANDPQTLARWYETMLGMTMEYHEEGMLFHATLADPKNGVEAQFGIKSAATPLSDSAHAIRVNYEVDDFAGFIETIRRKGVAIDRTSEQVYGSFAYIFDPEGNEIELWGAPNL